MEIGDKIPDVLGLDAEGNEIKASARKMILIGFLTLCFNMDQNGSIRM